ncbi:hypothetical protein B1R94_19825 [Mycolicibacterium litorale]|nr:hypothetical protein B1R94_19825 [Mycolicibacterium litorale]
MMSTVTPLVVVARWRVAEEQLDAVLALVAQLSMRSRAEPGCLGYDVMQGIDEPTTLVLVERYADRAALDAHLNSEHYQGLGCCGLSRLMANSHSNCPHDGQLAM